MPVLSPPEPGAIPFLALGKITARSASEIVSSSWSVGCETLDRGYADYAKYKAYLGPLGAKSARFQAGWAKTERTPGVYDWAWLDVVVDDCLAQGVQPWLQLSYGNPVYPGGGEIQLGGRLPHSPEAIAAWSAWTRAMVERYRDRVFEWEIWNEPDLKKAIGTVAEYTELFIRTASIIREVQPKASIYALSLAARLNYTDEFLTRLKAAGRLDLIDAITFHGYPPVPDDVHFYRELRYFTDKYAPGLPLRQGETGAPSGVSQGALFGESWTERKQAKWNLRRMLAFHALEVPFNLFTLAEFSYPETVGRNMKGILSMREGHVVDYPKLAYFAAQHVFSVFDCSLTPATDFDFTGPSRNGLSLAAWRKKHTYATVIAFWQNGSVPREEDRFAHLSFRAQNTRFADPVVADLLSGVVYELPRDHWSVEGSETVFRDLPIYDSPFLVAERGTFLFS